MTDDPYFELRAALAEIIERGEELLKSVDTSAPQRAAEFKSKLEDDLVRLLGREHPILRGALREFNDYISWPGPDRAVREAVDALISSWDELAQPGQSYRSEPAAEAVAESDAPSPDLRDARLKRAGVEGGRLYVSVPWSSSPLARLWRWRKRTRAGLLLLAVALFVTAGLTLGWIAAVGSLAVALLSAMLIAARQKPPDAST